MNPKKNYRNDHHWKIVLKIEKNIDRFSAQKNSKIFFVF